MWPVARMGEVTEVSPLYGTEVEAEAMAAPVESAQQIRPVEAEPLILGEISTEASSYDDDDDPPCGCCCEGSKGGAECCGHDHVWTSCWAISAVAAMVVFWWMYQTWYETFRAPREPGEVREPRERARRARVRLPPFALERGSSRRAFASRAAVHERRRLERRQREGRGGRALQRWV